MSTVTLNAADVALAASRLTQPLPAVRDALSSARAACQRATASASAELATALADRGRDVDRGVGALLDSVSRLAAGIGSAADALDEQDDSMGGATRNGRAQ